MILPLISPFHEFLEPDVGLYIIGYPHVIVIPWTCLAPSVIFSFHLSFGKEYSGFISHCKQTASFCFKLQIHFDKYRLTY